MTARLTGRCEAVHLAQLLVLGRDVLARRLLDPPDRRLCPGHLRICRSLRLLQMRDQ